MSKAIALRQANKLPTDEIARIYSMALTNISLSRALTAATLCLGAALAGFVAAAETKKPPPKGTIDCKEDVDCFIMAVQSCRPAKIRETLRGNERIDERDLHRMEQNHSALRYLSFLVEIQKKGPQGLCQIRVKETAVEYVFAPGTGVQFIAPTIAPGTLHCAIKPAALISSIKTSQKWYKPGDDYIITGNLWSWFLGKGCRGSLHLH